MKTRLLTVVYALAVTLWASPGHAASGEDIAVDALLVRPVCVAATAIGSILFCVSLPIAAITGSVKSSAHALVAKPARAAFTRPLGDFQSLEDYED